MRALIASPLGPLLAHWTPEGLAELRFAGVPVPEAAAWPAAPERERLAAWLAEFFAGRPQPWLGPLAPAGSAFERRIWALLRTIPYGETRSYGALATALGQPKAARAVGRAVARNPLALLIPCHRVIGAAGGLTGYAWGLERKRALLALEGASLQPSLSPPSTGSTAPVM
jgi:methylated-DNA-[protein]-cysteine S-methyltransferase